MSKGLKFSQMADLLEKAVVEESKDQIKRVNQEVSVSKISLVSGVNRAKVNDIINSSNNEIDLTANTFSKVIGKWSSDPKYLNRDGSPKELSIVGSESEFSQLVLSVTKQVSPYTVLFELKRTKSVEATEDKAKLIIQEYWTGHNQEETYQLVSNNIDNLLRAVDENLLHIPESVHQLHLTTEYDNIVESELAKIKSWILRKGEIFHKELREYLVKFDKDLQNDLTGVGEAKVSITTFSLSTPKIVAPEIKPKKRGRKKKNEN